jgi:hypothetical protein
MCPEFWKGFREGIDVFHRNERAPLYSSERSRPFYEVTRDISCGKRRREKAGGGWWSLGLVINAYLHGLFTRR